MLTVLRIFVSYSAVYVVFVGCVYFIGCIIIVILSPKICKSLFAGTSAIGTMLGGALTAVAAGALAATGFAGATGMLGSGGLGKAASSISGISPPGGSAPGPDPTLGQSKSAGGKSPGAEEAAIATGMSQNERPKGGLVSQAANDQNAVSSLAGSNPRPQPAGTIPDVNNRPMNVSSAPQPTPASGSDSGQAARPASATSSKGSRLVNIAKGVGHVAKHTAMAAASGGSLSGYVQSHMSFLDKQKRAAQDSHADDGVPDAKS